MDGNIGRLRELNPAPTPLRPLRPTHRREQREGSFEDVLGDDEDSRESRAEPKAEESASEEPPLVPPPSDGIGSQLDLTACTALRGTPSSEHPHAFCHQERARAAWRGSLTGAPSGSGCRARADARRPPGAFRGRRSGDRSALCLLLRDHRGRARIRLLTPCAP